MSKNSQKLTAVLFTFTVFLFDPSSCQNECAPEAMSRCTDPLKVVTDNKDLGFATSIEELQEMCPKLMEGLRCIDEFTMKCLDREHRAYFNTLYAGTTQVIIDLCQEGEYQSAYLKHAPCMRHVQNGYEKCAAEYQVRIKSLNEKSQKEDEEVTQPKVTYEYYDESQPSEVAPEDYEPEVPGETTEVKTPTDTEVVPPPPRGNHTVHDHNEAPKSKDTPKRSRRQASLQTPAEYAYEESQPDPEENVRLLCCSFQKYLHCSESVVNETCGYETAKFTKGFLDRMSGPLIQGHCQAYEFTSDSCEVADKFPQTEYTNNQHVSDYTKNPASFSSAKSQLGSFQITVFSTVLTVCLFFVL